MILAFDRMQSVLEGLLPEWCFRALFNLAWHGYKRVERTVGEIRYLRSYSLSYLYYVFKRDTKSLRRLKTVHLIRPYSMVGMLGLFLTYDLAAEIEKNNIDGCFVECGVARGGSSALMAVVADENRSNRKIWLFDSFEGLPEPAIKDECEHFKYMPEDRHYGAVSAGYCLGTYEEVERLLFSRLCLDKDNVFMVKGWFQDTLPKYKDRVRPIAILRIDADLHASTKCCLENLYDNVVDGGYIIIDDYVSIAGCKKATDEFLKDNNLDVDLILDGRGGCYFVKPQGRL